MTPGVLSIVEPPRQNELHHVAYMQAKLKPKLLS